MLVAVLISVSVLSVNTKSAFADTWGLSPIQYYDDTSLRISDCTPYGNLPTGDADGDGICDHWEDGTYGDGLHIHFTQNGNNYSYDLSCNPSTPGDCPSATHKDVYVELDWMQDALHNQAPNSNVIPDVVSAFNNSPVQNPDSTTGVHLHVQYGENPSSSDGNTGVFVTSLKVKTALWNTNFSPNYGFWVLKENRWGTSAERSGDASICPVAFPTPPAGVNANAYDCLTAKRQVFHYAVYIYKQYESATSSGWSEILGNDFVISLGSFANGVGSIDDQEASFMHELGHNLGLYHGGAVPPDVNANGKFDQTDDDSDNCKPNYPSIMSYTYEFRSAHDQCRPLDYSQTALSNLNENTNGLTDSNVGTYTYPSPYAAPSWLSPVPACFNTAAGTPRQIWYGPTVTMGTTGVTVDWNGNGISGQTYSQNLNNLGVSGCSTTNLSTLRGHNDWTGGDMNYQFTVSASSASGNVTSETGSSQCDGISDVPIGYIKLPQVSAASSSNETSLSKQLNDIGGIQIQKPGYSGASGGAKNVDKIIVTGVVDMTDALTKTAESVGGKYEPAGSYHASSEGSENAIPVYILSNSTGDLSEWSCSAHQEVTLETVKQLRSVNLQSIKDAINGLPISAFQNHDSDISTLTGYINNAFQANDQNDLNGVLVSLASLGSATDGSYGRSSSDDLITSESQKIIYPKVYDAYTAFVIAGGTPPSPTLPKPIQIPIPTTTDSVKEMLTKTNDMLTKTNDMLTKTNDMLTKTNDTLTKMDASYGLLYIIVGIMLAILAVVITSLVMVSRKR